MLRNDPFPRLFSTAALKPRCRSWATGFIVKENLLMFRQDISVQRPQKILNCVKSLDGCWTCHKDHPQELLLEENRRTVDPGKAWSTGQENTSVFMTASNFDNQSQEHSSTAHSCGCPNRSTHVFTPRLHRAIKAYKEIAVQHIQQIAFPAKGLASATPSCVTLPEKNKLSSVVWGY